MADLTSGFNGDEGNAQTAMKKRKKKKKKTGVHPRQNVRVNLSDCNYPVVARVIKYLGWSKASKKENAPWDIYWKDNGSFSVGTVRQMCPHGSKRKVNHFGGMAEICLKHLLAHNMNRMKKEFPKHYTFHPKTWVLPHDKPLLAKFIQSKRVKPTLICKPSDSCQGRGIYLTRKMPEFTPTPNDVSRPSSASDSDSDAGKFFFLPRPSVNVPLTTISSFDHLPETKTRHQPLQVLVVQEYVPRPYLINGYKFDMRLYCLITSVQPNLRAFLHKEGMARFCTTEYKAPSNKNLKCSYMHLTNFAINRKNKEYEEQSDDEEVPETTYPEGWNPSEDHPLLHAKSGSKWTMTALFEHLATEGHDVDKLWTQLKGLVAKTILPIRQMLNHQYRASFSARENGFGCYELLGFDVMLDSKLRPVLIEVNHLPSFETSMKIDDLIKSRVITDSLMLAGIDELTLQKRIKKKKKGEKVAAKPVEAEERQVNEEISSPPLPPNAKSSTEYRSEKPPLPPSSTALPAAGTMPKNKSVRGTKTGKTKGNGTKSSGKFRLIGTGTSNNSKLTREELMKQTLEVEKERTIYEETYRGGFERIVPLPTNVGGVDSHEAENLRELFSAMQAAKSRLHKTTNAAAKRLEEIKRKRQEREEQEEKLKQMRQRHATRVTTDVHTSGMRDKVATQVSKEGYVFQVSSRLYPGPGQQRNNGRISYSKGTANAPNVPYIASRGMSANKMVLKTSTITLLAPKDMPIPQSGINYTSNPPSNVPGNTANSGRSSMIYNGVSSGAVDYLNVNSNGNDGYIFSENKGFTKVPKSNRGNAHSNIGVVRTSSTINGAGNMSISTRGSFGAIYGGARRSSGSGRVRNQPSHITANASVGYDPRYAKTQPTGSHISRAWLNNATLDQVSLNPAKSSLNYNFWEDDSKNTANRSNHGSQRAYYSKQ
jgi:tubulin polyglutamylase TTLL6/13